MVVADMVCYVAEIDFFKLKKNMWPICIWPNLSATDFDLADTVTPVTEMDFFPAEKAGPMRIRPNWSATDIDLADMV